MTELASEKLRAAAVSFPHQVAVMQDGRSLTWSEFDREVEVLSRRLIATGLSRGQAVMVMGENSPEFLIACFAVWRAGGVMAVVHASFGPAELDYAMTNAEPRFLFVEAQFMEAAVAALKRTGVQAQAFELTSAAPLLAAREPFAGGLPVVDPAALGIIGYTSGTTGRPKPVALAHETIARGTEACASIWRIDSSDTVLVSMPLSWLAGLIILSITATARGARICLLRRFSPEGALDAMLDHKVTFLFGSTTMYAKIVDAWGTRTMAGDFSLRCCISGGEARNEAVFDEWRNITGISVLDSYGASECWPFVTSDPGVELLPPRGSAGKLVEGASLRLVDPDGQEVGRGEPGEVLGRAPCMMMCYWNEPDLTAEAMTPDGWYRIGDYARVDDDGYVYVLGRASDQIISGATRVFPAEVEQVLSELDYIRQVAVVGLPDPDLGQVVAAAVVTRAGGEAEVLAMQAYCAKRLAKSKVPGIIRVVAELPHNASGKVLRREVVPVLLRLLEAEKA